MRRSLLRGWQATLLLTPLISFAQTPQDVEPTPLQSSVIETIDTTVSDTLVTIEMPPTSSESAPSDASATDDGAVSSDRQVDFPLGMLVPVPEEELTSTLPVGVGYRGDDLLIVAPAFIDSALGAAHAASGAAHMQDNQLDLARADFEAAVAADPNNEQAYTSLGFLNAWSARHKEAAAAFHHALAINPRNVDAAKGLAYVALWSNNADEAAARFGALSHAHPDDVELALQHGHALVAAKRSGDAVKAFDRVLKLDPTNTEARRSLLQARSARPKVELTTWLGVTWFDDEERPNAESNVGFRHVEVAIWPSSKSRIWFQYDNGLSLDNVVLAAGNRSVPAGYIGGFLNHSGNHTTRLELGWRSLPGTVGEVLLRSEHVVMLQNKYALKGGLWLGLRSDDRTESIVHAGLGIPIGDQFEVAPTFFFASNGMPNEREWRILLAAEYRTQSDWRISGGLAGGQASTGYIDDFRGISDRYLKVSAPVGHFQRAHALLRTEFVGETDATTVFSVGLTFGLSER